MSEFGDLYQELILDHNKRPRNRRRIEGADREAEGFNPLCGDHVRIFLKLKNNVIEDIAFEGSGCAISTASASLMTERLKGHTVDEAKEMFRKFHAMVTGEVVESRNDPGLGKLEAFSGVCQYPARVKCATLVWHTVTNALEGEDRTASTE